MRDYIVKTKNINEIDVVISVLNDSNNIDLSFSFIDFIMKPKNAALNAEHNFYASLNKESYKHIKKSLLDSELIYIKSGTKIINDELSNETSI